MRHAIRSTNKVLHLPTLGAALAIDTGCVAAHVVTRLNVEAEPMLLISSPHGIAEIFQYVKEATISLLLATAAWQQRTRLFVLWALLFGYLMFDDGLELHERAGHLIASWWQFPAVFGLRPRDLGEITVSLGVASMFLIGLYVVGRRSPVTARASSADLTCLLALLGFFGVFVDTAHIALEQWRGLTLLEDGGEMLAMSLILAYTVRLQRPRPIDAPGSLWRWLRTRLRRRATAEPLTQPGL